MAQLPARLFATGVQATTIAPLGPGVIAHRYDTETREVQLTPYGDKRREQYPIAACAAGTEDPDEGHAYSLHWAASQGAVACTEPKCFPEAA